MFRDTRIPRGTRRPHQACGARDGGRVVLLGPAGRVGARGSERHTMLVWRDAVGPPTPEKNLQYKSRYVYLCCLLHYKW